MTSLSKTIAALIGFSLLAFNAQQAAAQSKHEGLYQVELIIFSRNDATSREQFAENIKLRYPNRLEQLKAIEPDSAVETPNFTKLPETQRTLNNEAKRLANSSGYRVLFHEAWQQHIGDARSSRNLAIQGGKPFGEHFELEGSLQVTVATYLKMTTNLWMSEFTSIIDGQELEKTIELPPMPAPPKTLEELEQEASLDSLFENSETTAQSGLELEAANTTEPSYAATHVILMQQKRDMRSDEIHYIDHPKLGVIAKITPLNKLEN